jgi:hypothetical protein
LQVFVAWIPPGIAALQIGQTENSCKLVIARNIIHPADFNAPLSILFRHLFRRDLLLHYRLLSA